MNDDDTVNMPKIPNTLEQGDILYVDRGDASTIDFTECAWIDHGRLYLSSLYMEEYVGAEVVSSRDELEMFIAYLRQLGDIVFPMKSVGPEKASGL